MTPRLLELLSDPETGESLRLFDAVRDCASNVVSGILRTPSGRQYEIRDGIPRFGTPAPISASVESFGRQWNLLNFEFKENWRRDTVGNTFGSPDVFKGRLVVDAAAGSGAQTRWMLEAGAEHVIALELSDAVDGVVRRNLEDTGFRNYDIIQCSIDAPPLKPGSIEGIVICHNAIQHTRSVEETARKLFAIVAPGGEFVFNCYRRNDRDALRWLRFHGIYTPLRWILSRLPFGLRLAYSRTMGFLRQTPGLGAVLEKTGVCMRGEVHREPGDTDGDFRARRRRGTVLNTFDWFGAHAFQHHKSDDEIRALVSELQTNPRKVLNLERYFAEAPPGGAIRIRR